MRKEFISSCALLYSCEYSKLICMYCVCMRERKGEVWSPALPRAITNHHFHYHCESYVWLYVSFFVVYRSSLFPYSYIISRGIIYTIVATNISSNLIVAGEDPYLLDKLIIFILWGLWLARGRPTRKEIINCYIFHDMLIFILLLYFCRVLLIRWH